MLGQDKSCFIRRVDNGYLVEDPDRSKITVITGHENLAEAFAAAAKLLTPVTDDEKKELVQGVLDSMPKQPSLNFPKK